MSDIEKDAVTVSWESPVNNEAELEKYVVEMQGDELLFLRHFNWLRRV